MSTELALTPQQAIDNIHKKFPAEAEVLAAIARKDIVVLGTDKAFALRDDDGEIKAFKQSLTLSVANGGLIQPVPNGPFVVSAQGYEMWAETSGASVIFPKEVLVDGQWQPNPAVIRDKENRRILCIYARAVAFKFSSKGIPQVSDWSTIFDTPSYRLIDLLGKAKKFPQAFRLLPEEMGAPKEDYIPENGNGDPIKGTWAKYPFDESTALWVNTAHPESLNWYAQILNREKKAIDFAQTFAKRNALKHLSGIQKAPITKYVQSGKFTNPVYADPWTFPVLCWRPTSGNIVKWDATRYAEVQEKAGGLITSNREAFAPGDVHAPKRMTIESKQGVERVSESDDFEGMERETDPEDQTEVLDAEYTESETPETDQPEVSQPVTEELSPEDQKIFASLAEAMDQFQDEYDAACKSLSIDRGKELTKDEAVAIIEAISAILDSSN